MKTKEVSQQKFDAIMKKSISLKLCPICGASGEIVVNLPWYGQTGAKVRCSKCNNSTKFFDIHSQFSCERFYGSPILEKSIIRGICSAIQSWNAVYDKLQEACGK